MTTPDSPLDQLELALRPHAHGTEAIGAIRDFVQMLPNTKARAELLNSAGALVTLPIDCEEAKSLGYFPNEADMFWVLAGDIVSTERAFTLGERVTSERSDAPRPRFIVASATCDLVPGRSRTKALLFEVHPIYKPKTEEEGKQVHNRLGSLLSFKQRHFMYLPPLPGDGPDVIANVVSFDDFAVARVEDLILAERVAALSLPGWRIFAALLRVNLTREGEFEAEMRLAHSGKNAVVPTIGSGMKA